MQILAIDIGSSFAEAVIFDTQIKETTNASFFERTYMPRQSLKSVLAKFVADGAKPEQVIISSRYIEKLYDFRLGGSLAQIVTKGFEGLPETIQKQGSPALFSSDLIRGVTERISADGQVITELDEAEVATVVDELIAKQAKRVCVHLLNARMNETHQKAIAKICTDKGLEVFIPNSEIISERQAWLQNILNAAVSGTFLELRDEIKSSLGDDFPNEKIFFINENGEPVHESQAMRFSTVFGLPALLKKNYPDAEVLHLGLEKFFFLHSRSVSRWLSPWGKFDHTFPSKVDLQIQPSCTIDFDQSGILGFSKKHEGFEPGPMLFGRGQKPMVADLILPHSAPELVTENGSKKLMQTLTTLGKNCIEQKGNAFEKIIQNLVSALCLQIAEEVFQNSKGTKIILHGKFAEMFAPKLKKLLPEKTILVAGDQNKTDLIKAVMR